MAGSRQMRAAAGLAPLILGLALAVCGCGDEEPAADGGEVTPTPHDVSGIASEDDALAAELAKAGGIASKEGSIKEQQARYIELARRYEEQTGGNLKGVSLDKEQAALLETMMSKEQDVSLRGMMQALLDTRTSIETLEDEIADLKEQLPTPDVVEHGDSHLSMAIDYLVKNHGLSEKEADKLARRSLLTDQIAPGMEVWHFYADGVYGTTVTQGTARVSPYFLNVRARRKLESERDLALEQNVALEAEIVVLETTRDELRLDLELLTEEHMRVSAERDHLEVERDDLVADNESVFYYVDTKRALREKDILAPMNMKLRDWRKDLFTSSLDLREDASLAVYAEDFGVRRIGSIKLLPQKWREGDDYRVTFTRDHSKATVHFDNKSKFRDEAVVIVLR